MIEHGDKMDGILLINKPIGMTSHDVIDCVRKVLHTRKVGHCGTLDPDAAGVLVICVGKATKALQFLMSEEKGYEATLCLGSATDTYDQSGQVIQSKPFDGIKQDIDEVLASFIGKQQQMPPMYSAIKVNGKKLYEYARKQEKVEVLPRDIEIYDIQKVSVDHRYLTFKVHCSKGTYIRSLCVDIAKKLDYPGHMCRLVRFQSGQFSLEECVSLEDLQQGKFHLMSLEEAFSHFDHITVHDENIVYHGKMIKSDIDHQVVVCNQQGRVLAVYGPNGQGFLKSIRGLF